MKFHDSSELTAKDVKVSYDEIITPPPGSASARKGECIAVEAVQDNYGRYTDKVLDDLYEKQSRTTDSGERRRLIREFEKRLLDDETHYVPTLQYHRIIPHSVKVRGWTITPSHCINQQLDTVWLAH